MKREARSATVRLLAAILAALTLTPSALLEAQQDDERRENIHPWFGRTGVGVPEPSDAGSWYGTWWYESRDYRMALWFREAGERPELSLQFFRFGLGEGFRTDWNGEVEYLVKANPGTFHLDITEGDEIYLRGTWNWLVEFPASGRSETGEVTIYRIGDGRRLAVVFDNLVRVMWRGTERTEFPLNQVWTFRKASRRLVRWEELPF
jgi:hypothetical protein